MSAQICCLKNSITKFASDVTSGGFERFVYAKRTKLCAVLCFAIVIWFDVEFFFFAGCICGSFVMKLYTNEECKLVGKFYEMLVFF